VLSGADGIAVSCSDANKLTDAINSAVKNGVPVATFDSEAPRSQRFVTYGIDDEKCGEQVMEALAKELDGKGTIAILAGSQNAPNLQKRVQGVKNVAAKFPGITIRSVYYHKETPQDAAAKIEQVMQANPDINGWAFIGGWPLFTDNALKWAPGTVKCVSVDALPAELSYIRSGHVQLLLSQQCYEWGHRSVELLINKIYLKQDPASAKDISALIPVTKGNVDEFAKNWDKWLPK
jgi:ribose transport system substrate-binding protein